MASVTVETVTVLLVGMETDVNSNVTSAHGKAGGDARLQMAKSAATEVCLPVPKQVPKNKTKQNYENEEYSSSLCDFTFASPVSKPIRA